MHKNRYYNFQSPKATSLYENIAPTVSDADPNGTASDYSATINWGDGSTSPATIGTTSGGFSATGSHTYAKKGTFSVKVTVTDTGGSQISETVSVTIK